MPQAYAGGGTRTLKGLLPPDFESQSTLPRNTNSGVPVLTTRDNLSDSESGCFPLSTAQYVTVPAQSRHNQTEPTERLHRLLDGPDYS